MKDFTLSAFETLLSSFLSKGYTFITFEDYLIQQPNGKYVMIRHDVDDLPDNSHQTAIIENKLGIRGTYYFRIVQKSNHPEVIKAIVKLNHEVGYHFEDLALAHGNEEKAIMAFEKNLAYFRQYYPVKTICMHGSPMSKWDNQSIWKKYDYKKYGIIGDPYSNIDFTRVLYITDTGRRWDGKNVSIRDKVDTSFNFTFHSTLDIVNAIDTLPEQIMITTHPQRWNDNTYRWMKELVLQNGKNLIKRIIIS